MGLLGVEGIFRRCSEISLEVLRENSKQILTLLDILKHDPFYSWTISPVRFHRTRVMQKIVDPEISTPDFAPDRKNTSQPDSIEAERAILIVSRKLANTLSVEATVNELIREARSTENLALLYCGWAAYA